MTTIVAAVIATGAAAGTDDADGNATSAVFQGDGFRVRALS